VHSSAIGNGMEVNMMSAGAVDRDGSVLDYCRLKDITIQAWSPLQYRSGTVKGAFFQYDDFSVLSRTLEEMGCKYGISAAAMAVAWLLRHPAGMQVLIGTMNGERFGELCRACDVRLSREDWYQIFKAAGNPLP
jgi:predicted oxidoreductase